MPRTVIIFLLPLFILSARAQEASPIAALSEKGYKLRAIDRKASFALQHQALEMARKANAREDMVQCYALLSGTRTNGNQPNIAAIQSYADSAYVLAGQLNTPGALAFGNMAQGEFYSFIDEYEKCLKYYLTALENFEIIKNNTYAAKVAVELSYQYSVFDAAKSFKYASLAVALAGQTALPDDILNARLALGSYYYGNQKNKTDTLNTIAYLKATADFAGSHEKDIYRKSNIGIAYLNLAVQYQITEKQEYVAPFLVMLDSALAASTRRNEKAVYRNCFGLKAQYLMRLGDYDAAEQLLNEGIEYQKSLPYPYQDNLSYTQFYTSLKNLAIQRKDYQKYYAYDTAFERYNKLYYNEASLQASQNADARYESSLKTNAIKTLEKENKLQRNSKWLAYGSAILLGIVVVLVLIIYYFRQKYFIQTQNILKEKQKTTELQLQLKEQESIESLEQKLSMERRLLQSQMDPHFMFNALGNIQSFILQNDTQNAVSYFSRFSGLMRQILEQSKKEYITLNNEVDTLKNYIELQQLRLNNSFTYTITIHDDIDGDTEIPPMLLQPFIENAIEHGLKPLPGNIPGLLNITFGTDDRSGHLVCWVQDNGIGLEQSKQNNKKTGGTHQSMATGITKERLNNMQKHNTGLFFSIAENKNEAGEITGTTATITLPTLKNHHV